MVEFIEVSVGDTDTIEFIARQTWPNTFGKLIPKEQIDYMLDLIYNKSALIQQMADGHNFLIIDYKSKPVGFTSYELNYKDESQLMIHKIYLLPASQGLGIGIKTFDHLTQIAKENKQTNLGLKVFYKNEKAIGFYIKKGFLSMGTEETDIGNGYVILDKVMTMNIV